MSVYGSIVYESYNYDYKEIVLEINFADTLREIKRKIKEAFRNLLDRLKRFWEKLTGKDSKYKNDPGVQKFKDMTEKVSERMSEIDDIESANDAEKFKKEFEEYQRNFEENRKRMMERHAKANEEIARAMENINKMNDIKTKNDEKMKDIDKMLDSIKFTDSNISKARATQKDIDDNFAKFEKMKNSL